VGVSWVIQPIIHSPTLKANPKASQDLADYWIWDNVHPTYRGHQLRADEWERVVRDFWK
jgi:phospholipase/lecithinase/hemolysin